MTTMNPTKRGVLIGLLIIGGAFAWLIYGGLNKNVVFFLTPTELLAKGAESYEKPVRLGGQVKPGTMKWDDQTLDLRFTVTDGGGDIAVHSKGAPPQMFRDGMGVVVEYAGKSGDPQWQQPANPGRGPWDYAMFSNDRPAPDDRHVGGHLRRPCRRCP